MTKASVLTKMSILPFKPFNSVCNRLDKSLSTERNGTSIMFKRDKYLNQLIHSRDNHQVKVITGIRRAGKNILRSSCFNTLEKKDQEYESLRNIPDSFKKVIIVKNEGLHYRTSEGFLRLSLLDFLTNIDSLDW